MTQSQYQMQSGNAIIYRLYVTIAVLLVLLLGVIDPPRLHALPLYPSTVELTSDLTAQSTSQSTAQSVNTLKAVTTVGVPLRFARLLPVAQVGNDRIEPPLILPLETTTVELLTHTADFTVQTNEPTAGGANLQLQLTALYRFQNPDETPVTVILKIGESNLGGTLDGLTLTAGNQPLTLFQTEGVGYTAQLQMNGDARTDVQLRYSVSLAERPLPLLAYDVRGLSAWRGSASLRVSIALPESITPDSWLHIAPDDWRYASANDNATLLGGSGIKWLYDLRIPQTSFLFEFIHPNQWAALAELSAQAAADPTAYLPLGNRYRTLLDATPLTVDYQRVRDRFYAQALAAYTAGIEAVAAPDERGALFAALAALYRIQAAQAGNATDAATTQYAGAMIDAAQEALATLPLTDGRRRELAQWVADGLQLRLANAQTAEEWPVALQTIEQLANLPPDLVDSDMLARTQRSIIVRQALQLLEEDSREEAIALAGSDVVNAALQPAADELPLFRRWEISATISPAQVALTVVPFGLPARQAQAEVQVAELVSLLQTRADSTINVTWQPVSVAETESAATDRLGELSFVAPVDSSFASLTTAIAPTPHWALLQALLRQLPPVVASEARLLNQQTELRLPLDLQNVGVEWNSVATSLDEQAVAMAAEAAAQNTRDPVAAEAALQLRIQSANYRAAAAEWQRLTRDSWVAVEMSVPSGLQENRQSWLLSATSAAQLLSLQSAPGYAASFMGILVLCIAGVVMLSGLLWWLL